MAKWSTCENTVSQHSASSNLKASQKPMFISCIHFLVSRCNKWSHVTSWILFTPDCHVTHSNSSWIKYLGHIIHKRWKMWNWLNLFDDYWKVRKLEKIMIIESQFNWHDKWQEMELILRDPKCVDFYKETDCYSFRHNDKLTLKMRYARTNVLKYTYFHRVVDVEHGTPFPFPFMRQQVWILLKL